MVDRVISPSPRHTEFEPGSLRRLGRRSALKLLMFVGGTALVPLLQACGGAPAPAAPGTAKPSGQSASAAPPSQQAPASKSADPAKPADAAKPAAATGPVKRGGTLVLGTAQPIETLDPHKTGLRNNRNAWSIFDGLTRWGADGLPQPALAKSWETSPDGLTWTFKLQSGIKLHNGRVLNADDVKYTIERVQAKETASPVAGPIAEIQSTEVADPETIRFKLSTPSGALLAGLIDVMIVPKDSANDLPTKAVGTGPFKVKEYVVNDHVTLEKNPDYWDKGADGQALPYLDAVTIRTLTDTTALFTALTTATVDVFWQMPPQFVVQLEKSQQANVVWSTFKTIHDEFFFEIERGQFQDRRAREAMLYALDRQALVDAGYFGYAEPHWNNNIIAPGSWAEKTDLPEYKRDPQKAKELFRAVNITDIKFVAPSVNPEWKPISEVIERNLSEIGIKFTTELMEINAWYGVIGARSGQPWKDTTAFASNIAFRPPEPAILLVPYGCKKHFAMSWCNQDMDDVAAQGRRGSTQDERKAAYIKYQELWQRELPSLIFAYRGLSHGTSKRVHDLGNLFGDIDYTRTWLDS